MKTKATIIYALLLVFAFSGCEGSKKKDTARAIQDTAKKPKRIIVIGIDETGSYGFWGQMKNMTTRIIENLRPGDILYVRRVTGTSYLDNSTIFRLEVPLIREAKTENPFDRKSKRRLISEIFKINMLKKEACSRISAVRFTNAKNTDIYGFLAAANDKFDLAPQQYQRILIIASDLKDNVGHKVNLEFSNVQVAVVGFQNSKKPAKTMKLKKMWIKRLTDAGASKIVFLSIEEGFSMDIFKGAQT